MTQVTRSPCGQWSQWRASSLPFVVSTHPGFCLHFRVHRLWHLCKILLCFPSVSKPFFAFSYEACQSLSLTSWWWPFPHMRPACGCLWWPCDHSPVSRPGPGGSSAPHCCLSARNWPLVPITADRSPHSKLLITRKYFYETQRKYLWPQRNCPIVDIRMERSDEVIRIKTTTIMMSLVSGH